MAILGDVIELSIVVKDLEEAAKRFETLFDLKVHHRGESKEFGFINAIIPLGKGHIELMQPTDPSSAAARFLESRGEGVYLVGFESSDVHGNSETLRERGARVTEGGQLFRPEQAVAWVHPRDAHGVFVEIRTTAKYD